MEKEDLEELKLMISGDEVILSFDEDPIFKEQVAK